MEQLYDAAGEIFITCRMMMFLAFSVQIIGLTGINPSKLLVESKSGQRAYSKTAMERLGIELQDPVMKKTGEIGGDFMNQSVEVGGKGEKEGEKQQQVDETTQLLESLNLLKVYDKRVPYGIGDKRFVVVPGRKLPPGTTPDLSRIRHCEI